MPPDTARQQDAALGRIETRQAKEDQARRSYEADKAKSNGIVQQIAAKGDKPEAAAQINALTGGKASAGGGDAARGPVGGLSPHKKSADGDLTAADAAKFGKQLASEAKKPNKSEELAGANDAPAIATDGGRGASDGGGDAPSPEAAGEGAGGEGSLGAASQVTEAPPSVFAGEIGTAGKEIAEAGKLELAATSEALPEFTAVMSGEDKQPGAASIAKVSADANIPQGGEGPDATAPDLRMEPKLKGRKGKPGADLKGAQAETPPEVLRELFAASLSRIDTDSTSNTSPGPAPTVQLSGSSSPTRASDEAGEAIARSDDAFVSNIAAIDAGPGPEQVQPQALQETIDPATFEMPAIPEVPADPAMLAYMSKGHEKAVYDQADADQGPVFDASMAAAQKEFETAVTLRDESHEQEVATATEAIATQNEQAAADQSAAVTAARAEIDKGRSDTKDKQEEELKKAKKAGDRERRATEQTIDARRQDDDKKIQTQYKEAEKKADAEKDKAESKAAAEKSKAEEKQGDESWWDSAASAVGSFLDSVASAVTAIFDTLSAAVGSILNAVKDAAMSVIDAAISFATSALDTLGGVLKGLVNSLLADIFPSLAAALNGLIDSAVNMAKEGITAIGEQLKAGVAAAVDTLNAGIQAVVAAYKVAVTTALAIASAAVSGDWEGALKAMLGGALSLAGIDQGAFYGLVGQGMDTINAIVDDPGTFVGNMVDAVGQGFSQFAGNFPTHLMTGAISWLTGSLGEAGLKLPDTWDAGGIFTLVLDVMGLSYDKIRGKVADRVGEENVAMLESAWGYVQAAIDGGLEGLWEHAKGQLGNLWQGVLDAALGFLMEKVVTAAVTKIASMFSPVGAIVQALITVWNVYKFVQEQASRIMGLVTAVVDGMSQIVAGQLGPAANMIEGSLAGLVPVAISLLANLLGLGGVSAKVKEIIEALQGQVGGAVDFVLDKLVDLGKSAFEAVSGAMGGGKKEEPAAAANAEPAAAQVDPAAAAAALGAPLPFKAGAEDHKVWVANEGGQASVMMASTPTKVSDKVQELRPKLAELPKEESKKAGSAIGKVIAIERKLDQMGKDALAGGVVDAAAIEAKKAELAAAVADMLLALPAEASLAAFNMEMSLTGENFKTFEKQLAAMYGQMGKSPSAGEAAEIWKLLATGLVASTNDFEQLRNVDTNRIQWDKDAAVLDKVIAEFNPLLAALEPAMRTISALSPTWAFWSGDPGKDAAVKNGVNALEGSAIGAAFDGINIDGNGNMQLWATLSRAFAAYAAEEVEGRTFIGFFGQSPRGDSVVEKIEQPKFRGVTGEKFGATPTITAYAAASVPSVKENKEADLALNGGMKGTYATGSSSAAAGAAAKEENTARRTAFDQLFETVGAEEADKRTRGKRLSEIQLGLGSSGPVAAVDPQVLPQTDAKTVPHPGPNSVAPVDVSVPVGGGDPKVAQLPNTSVGVGQPNGEVQSPAPVKVPEGRSGGPAPAAGQGNGVVEVEEGKQVAGQVHAPTPAQPEAPVNAAAPPAVAPPAAALAAAPAPKTDPAQLPAMPFKDGANESHTLYIQAEGGRAKVMKASTPTDITNAFDVADGIKANVEAWLKLEAESAEANALMATIKREMARLLTVMTENRAPTDLAKQRQEFERKLGLFAMTDGNATGSVKELMGKCAVVIDGIAAATRGPEQALDARIDELVKDCGKSIDSGFAGAIGKSVDELKLMLRGGGNLREMALVAYNFQEVIARVAPQTTPEIMAGILARVQAQEREVALFKQRVAATKPDDKKNVKTLFSATSEEGNKEFSEGQAEFAKAKKHDTVTGREMDQKLPDVPLAALPDKTLRDLGRQKGVPGWDTKSLADLVAALTVIAGKAMAGGAEGSPLARSSRPRAESGVDLSTREGKAESQQGPDVLPFIEGEIANLIDERNQWVKSARALEMPLKAGISGTTQRMMNFAKTMGTSSMPSMRFAMLGFLLPMNAHSFHEIMTSSRGHSGCDYAAGAYSPLPPVGESVLMGLAGGRETWEIIKGPTGGGQT